MPSDEHLTPQMRRYRSENAQYQASILAWIPTGVVLVMTENVIIAFAVWATVTMLFTAVLGWKRGFILNGQ